MTRLAVRNFTLAFYFFFAHLIYERKILSTASPETEDRHCPRASHCGDTMSTPPQFLALPRPLVEPLEPGEGRMQGRLAQLLPRLPPLLFGEMLIEGNGLFEVKCFEIAITGVTLKAIQGLAASHSISLDKSLI
jgi:hypothetical protein